MTVNPKHVEPLEIRAVGDEVLVHDEAHGKVHVLNATAGRVLEWCDGTRSRAQIADALATAYGIPAERASDDVATVLESFRAQGLLAA